MTLKCGQPLKKELKKKIVGIYMRIQGIVRRKGDPKEIEDLKASLLATMGESFTSISDPAELVSGMITLLKPDKASKMLMELYSDLNLVYKVIDADAITRINTYKTTSDIKFASWEVDNLFHSLGTAKLYFQQTVDRWVKEWAYEMGKEYKNDNKYLNDQMKLLKNDLFKQTVDYLIRKNALNRDDFYMNDVFMVNLYDTDNFSFNAANFQTYKEVMNTLYNNLLDSENFVEFNGNRIPNVSRPITDIKDVYDIYTAGVFLANFDTVMISRLGSLFDINPVSLDSFMDPLEGSFKYIYKPKGKHESYWADDNHMSESAEELSDKLSELFITTIPRKNKQNGIQGEHLVRNDFYAMSAAIDAFERKYIKEIHRDSSMNIISRDTRGMFVKHIENARNALYKGLNSNRTGLTDEQKTLDGWEPKYIEHFEGIADVVFSLYDYIQKIKEKEETSKEFSVYSILGNVLNNTFGATFATYIAGKNSINYKELYSHDAASIAAREKVYSRLSLNVDKEYLYKIEDINNLKTNKDFSDYIFSRYGLYISPKEIDDLKDDAWENANKRALLDDESDEAAAALRDNLRALIGTIYPKEKKAKDIFTVIGEFENRTSEDAAAEENTGSSIISNLLKDMQGILKTYLIKQKSTPLTTIEMSSGEKIPTFKLANLSYNDSEVLLRQLEYETTLEGKTNPNTTYRNMYVDSGNQHGQNLLVGTTTNLEVINKDSNKGAASWTPIENFIANFHFNFLGLASNPKQTWYNVMIGNYSDKNTILTKQINSLFTLDKQRVIGGITKIGEEEIGPMSLTDLRQLTRIQQLSFYNDLYREIVGKYNKLFGKEFPQTLQKTEDVKKTYNAVNALLATTTKNELLKKAHKLGVELTFEKDFSEYTDENGNKVMRLNQNIFDYIQIYSSKDNFDKFIKSDLDYLAFDLINNTDKKSSDQLFSNKQLDAMGTDGLDRVLNYFGIKPASMKSFIKEEKENLVADDGTVTEVKTKKVLIRNTRGTVNPLLERWHLVNMLFKNEYLNITVKHEYMHPAKKIKIRDFGELGDYEKYLAEASPRYSTMAKRNVSFTSTFERAVQDFVYGVPKNVNIAMIADPDTPMYNINGDEYKQEFQDGSSTMNYVYSKMVAASYPGKDYSGTLKRFGTFITNTGSAVKKDAEQVLTNKLMQRTRNNPIDYVQKQEQMLTAHDIDIENMDINTGNLAIFENGKYYLIYGVKIENNVLTRTMIESDSEGNPMGEIINEPGIKIKNLFDIWKALGAQYSAEFENGRFKTGEQSNELLYNVVTSQPDLKTKMIHIISNTSTFKSGATNVNPSTSWLDQSKLNFVTFDAANMGPQLAAGHAADKSKIKEISQVLSGLAQSPTTAHIAHMAYRDIAKLITEAAKNYISVLDQMNPETTQKLMMDLSESLVDSISRSRGATLASSLVTVFKHSILPFSNQNFFDAFIQDLVTKLNTDFIARYYDGLGAVLLPSHNAVMVYEKDGIVYTQDSLVNLALDSFTGEGANDIESIIKDYIGKTFQNKFITLSEVQVGDKIKINGKDVDITTPTQYYEVKYGRGLSLHAPVELIQNEPRNLKPQEVSFTFVGDTKVYSKEELAKKLNFSTLPKKVLDRVKEASAAESAKFNVLPVEGLRQSDGTILINGSLPDDTKIAIALHELVGHDGLAKLFVSPEEKGYLREILLSLEEYLVNKPELLLRGKFKNLDELAAAYKFDLSTVAGKLGLLEELFARHAEINMDQYAVGVLSTEDQTIVELMAMSRTALETGQTYTEQIAEGRYFQKFIKKNLFDLDSVRIRYGMKDQDKMSKQDKLILDTFAQKFGLQQEDGKINRRKADKFLLEWTQRELAFLDKNLIIEPIKMVNGKPDLDSYFGNDTLIDMGFIDAQKEYKTRAVADVNFKGAELILSNIYKSTFNAKDSITDIKRKGHLYFKESLDKLYKEEDTTEADFKVVLTTGEILYIKLTANEISAAMDTTFMKKGTGNQYSRMNSRGEKLYTLPPGVKMAFQGGKEMVYIKAASYDPGGSVVNNYKNTISRLLGSSVGVKALIPLLNQTDTTFVQKSGAQVNLEKELLDYFVRFYNINDPVADQAKVWYFNNMDRLLENISKKQYVSWDKSRYFIAARIPAQSMQSFMPMENIAYFDDDSNNAYVSVWQIWLQGSDFDIDKAYIMGYGFNKNSQYDLWTNMFDYDSKQRLDVLETLPIPTNVKADTVTEGGLDITEYTDWFNNVVKKAGNNKTNYQIANSMDIVDISEYLVPLLMKIKEYTNDRSAEAVAENIKLEGIGLIGDEKLIEFINLFNSYDGYIHSKHALQNSIVSKINRIISAPSNQLLATMPVTIQQWHAGADAGKAYRARRIKSTVAGWIDSSPKERIKIKQLITTLAGVQETSVNKSYKEFDSIKDKNILHNLITEEIMDLISKVERFSPSNSFGMYKQQQQAIIGKKDVGIGANGLKVGFALTDYYNSWYEATSKGALPINPFDNKRFHKKLKINGKTKNIVRIADVNISKAQIQEAFEIYGITDLVNEYNSYMALALSGFVSGATDNAKELVMAKINAVVDLASMHIYMLLLGYDANEISTYMNSPIGKHVAEGLEINLFNTKDKPTINDVMLSFRTAQKGLIPEKEINETVNTFMDVYNGSKEITSLASIFKINTSLKANSEELHNFLGILESAMNSAEHRVLGFNVKKLKRDFMKLSEKDKNQIFADFIGNNSTLGSMFDQDAKGTADYIVQTLAEARDIPVYYIDYHGKEQVTTASVSGGEFDSRFYVHPKNTEYRKQAANYYNLVKNTVNSFDVLENVPHFREMAHSVGITFQILILASKKANFAFSEIRDIITQQSARKIQVGSGRNADKIKNMLGNDSFRLNMDEKFLKRALRTFDTYMIASWLRGDDKQTKKLTFNVKPLLKQAGLNKITLFTSDRAKVYKDNELRSAKKNSMASSEFTKVITTNGEDDMIIDLTTDFGIANFKILVEQVLLPILQKSNTNGLGQLLTVKSVRNHFGNYSTQLVPIFGLSTLNNAVSIENFSKVINEFNSVDRTMDYRVRNASSKPIDWRDILYVYNLIVNDEAYGDLRLTPLFQDHAKENGSIAQSFLKYGRAVDKGEVDVFDVFGPGSASDANVLKKQQINNILFSIFNNKGFLVIDGENLRVENNNFLINTILPAVDYKDGLNFQFVKSIISAIGAQNLLINYICN